MKKFSPTYANILDLMMRLHKKAIVSPVYGNECDGSSFKRIDSGSTSHKIKQAIVISDPDISGICTTAEWVLVGRLLRELKEYNALWYCDPKQKRGNSSLRKAIKGLIDKGVLIKTESLNIYFVNPVHIRRGEVFAVLATTATRIMDASRVTTDHIVDCKPVKDIDFGFDKLLLLQQPDAEAN